MTGSVGDDEFSFSGRKVSIRNVDRDALFAFFFETVGEECWVKATAGRAVLCGVFFDRGERVFVDQFCVVEESPNERAFPIVDAFRK